MKDNEKPLFKIESGRLVGGLKKDLEPAPLSESGWYVAEEPGAGIEFRFKKGLLSAWNYLTADFLVDGRYRANFHIKLQEGEGGPTFEFGFSALTQCSARICLPLSAVNMNGLPRKRQGAWINAKFGGSRVDLAKVDRLTFAVWLKAEEPVRFCMTDIQGTRDEPAPLVDPVLPKGKLLNKLGQSATWDWPGKTVDEKELVARLTAQHHAAKSVKGHEGTSRWGGWDKVRFAGTGYFRTENDGKRWWLVDPDGFAFWSTGLNCVMVDTTAAVSDLEKALTWMPEKGTEFEAAFDDYGGAPGVNYLAANFIRAFGAEQWYDRWSEIAISLLRKYRFNTIANWSEWKIAQAAQFPYVRHLPVDFPNTPKIYRDFPDVFDPAFETDARSFAEPLEETASDPALIGYFLMNEPGWGFARETPAAGMLYNTDTCACRRELTGFLAKKHGDSGGISAAWGMDVSLDSIETGRWAKALPEAASRDLEEFSTLMVDRLYKELSKACRAVDPNHMNLGVRYCSTTPPDWALDGMSAFDVFSINWYYQRPDGKAGTDISRKLDRPILIGEWHYGSLDAGLPCAGLRRVRDQAARGDAYRVYIEEAAAYPWCVGAHWFTLYDQSAIGRFDGENFNCGFVDVCNRPYPEISEAAARSHERIYDVASGAGSPFSKDVWYNVRP